MPICKSCKRLNSPLEFQKQLCEWNSSIHVIVLFLSEEQFYLFSANISSNVASISIEIICFSQVISIDNN